MKPTPELINDWHEKARQMAIQADGYFDDAEHWRHFAELAASWGADKARHEAENAPWLTIAHVICTDAGIAHGPIVHRLEALRDKLAEQAQQTTDPLGFQIRRAIAAEDELRATKQTLEHAYAALQKVADAQAAIEEPELPEAALYRCEACRKTGLMIHCSDPINCGGMVSYFTAAQMHDHYAAGVRVGMAQQSQDAKRLDWLAIHGSFGVDSVTGLPGGNGQKRIAATRQAIDAAMQGDKK